jgi:pyridoxine 4-dehydrogenase
LKRCQEEGLAFIPWFPLDAGGLHEDALGEVARAHDATPAQVAIAWLLHHSDATLPIPGTSSIAHLEQNVAAASLRLREEDLESLAGTA